MLLNLFKHELEVKYIIVWLVKWMLRYFASYHFKNHISNDLNLTGQIKQKLLFQISNTQTTLL